LDIDVWCFRESEPFSGVWVLDFGALASPSIPESQRERLLVAIGY
jgi:hypothetical protein